MPSCLVHTKTWEYGRPKHRCSKPEKFHRSCATRLVSRTCAMLPVVASDLLFLLARSTVYGRTRILKTNFEVVLTTHIPEHQRTCAQRLNRLAGNLHRAIRTPTSSFLLSLLLDFSLSLLSYFSSDGETSVGFCFFFLEDCLHGTMTRFSKETLGVKYATAGKHCGYRY
jgi:hypothetical protein